MEKFNVEKEGNSYRAVFIDDNGMSVICRGSKVRCQEYVTNQKKRLQRGLPIKVSKSVYK